MGHLALKELLVSEYSGMVQGNKVTQGDEDGHLELRTTRVPQAYDKTKANIFSLF